MATKRLLIDAKTGVLFIGASTLPNSALTTPNSYLSDLNFHTALPYIQFIQTISVSSCTFSAQSRSVATWNDGKSGCF